MFMYRLGSSNGFLETIVLMVIVAFSLLASEWTPSPVLTLWYVALGLLILNVTWQFNSAGRSWQAKTEIEAMKANTANQSPAEVFAPYGAMWWAFRCVDVAMSLLLIGTAVARVILHDL